MDKDKEREDFERWQKAWDTSAEQFSKDYTNQLIKNQQAATSWLTNAPLDRDYQASSEGDIDVDVSWRDIYDRSQDLSELITEDEYKGDKKPEAHWGAFTPTKTNPNTQSGTGPDGVDPVNGGVRVTPNWSDSKALRELDEIKRRIEAMERKQHDTEVKSEKVNPSLKQQLKELRNRVAELSEKINSEPEVDVT